MNYILAIYIAVFTLAFFLGWRFYKSFFWNFVDLLYYPLAAAGVALLFIASDVQRDLFEVNQSVERQNQLLSDFEKTRPRLKVTNLEQLLDTHVSTIALVSQMAEACKGSPSGVEPRCLAASKLGPHIDKFLKTARQSYSSYEDRLLQTCLAGDNMLLEIRGNGAISSLVAGKLLTHYANASLIKDSDPLDYKILDAALATFKEDTLQYVEKIHRLAFKESDTSAKLLMEVEKEEIGYSALLFRGLYQCMKVPRKALLDFTSWTSAAKSQAQEVRKLEERRVQLKTASTPHTTSLWLQLHLWPFVLLAALSLKFAKGAATLRKARASREA